jgi:hypothetical protein
METTQIHRATALDTINSFIAGCEKMPLMPMDLDIVIILIRESISSETGSYGFVQAVKHVRTVTRASHPVKWDVDFEYSSGNALCKYINDHGMQATGTFKESSGLGLKDAVDICRFIKANIDLLTEQP